MPSKLEASKTPYSATVVEKMQAFYATLSEKDKRRYAALEAERLGHGGKSYIARILGCARNTITTGMAELDALSSADAETVTEVERIRRAGGGRPSYKVTHPGIDDAFLDVLQDDIAGDPMHEKVRWTHLTPAEIQQRLAEQHKIQVSEFVVRQLLAAHGFRRRQAQKNGR